MAKQDAVEAMMIEDAKRPPPKDKLDKLRNAVRELRDVEAQRESLTERQAELGKKVYELKTKTIVDLFDQAKVESIGIPAEGNLPAYELGVGWHYKANLGAVEPETLPKSIAYIKKVDPDLLKTTYTVNFGMGETKRRTLFENFLKKNKIDYSESFGVPWNTLTAWLKEQIEVKKKSPPLKLLGATVERTAQLIKQKKSAAERTNPANKPATKGKR